MRGCTCTGSMTLCDQCAALAQRAGVEVGGSGVAGARALDRGDTPGIARPLLTEKAFMAAVVRLAREEGWMAYHVHDSRRSLPGYPDLTLVHPKRHVALWAELKVEGVLTLQQAHWLKALGAVRETAAFVWTPEDMATIRMRLT